MASIGVVIVTYNRLEMLKKTLGLFDEQTFTPTYIIIVNNNSNDGTRDYLEQWASASGVCKRIVINKEINDGGSGGFYTGIKAALDENVQWVWVSDDDAFPAENALEMTAKYIDEEPDSLKNVSAICSKVINNGSIDLDHRRSLKPDTLTIKNIKHSELDYCKQKFRSP